MRRISKEEKQRLLASLSDMHPSVLEEVANHCRALIKLSPGRKQEAIEDYQRHEWLMFGIDEVMRQRGHPRGLPLARLVGTREYLGSDKGPGFKAAAEELGPWLRRILPENPTVLMERQISIVAAECLAKHVASFGKPFGREDLMWHYHRVPTAIEKQFPGYIEKGWTGFLIKHL